ncbi:hypothetical protein L2E82_20680 [Cichorium intybus]|uniref:Uncharacterized protein n=1 Tax=Cichorium intybus TaxID=13427 RepID=A0ACB9DV00_CICIN|nr:hypothetical protein L2E82_20680 [Cichorium intybus]
MTNFQYIDEKGFNWGLNVRMKSERTLKFLNESSSLKEERAKARKLSRGIEGFGSFSHRNSSENGVLQQSYLEKYKRSHSQFNEHGNLDENQISHVIQDENSESRNPIKKTTENPYFSDGFGGNIIVEKLESQSSSKENMAPKEDHIGESNPLLGDAKNDSWVMIDAKEEDEEDHPFNNEDNKAKMSLI